MENNEAMCYITYAVPARLMPPLPVGEAFLQAKPPCSNDMSEAPQIYPSGFMPDWFLRGSFPEDDF